MVSNEAEEAYNAIIKEADEYYKKALWQERLRLLQEAVALCDAPGFFNAAVRKQEHLYDLGCIRRRLGQYDQAERQLREALSSHDGGNPLARARILGELGVVLRHGNRFLEADDVFREQYALASDAPRDLAAESELCRAIGNMGMCSYNLSQQRQPADQELLRRAVDQLQERITRARGLQEMLSSQSESKDFSLAKTWETIGLDRLSLCYVALGDSSEAVCVTEGSQRKQTRLDPTVTAYSRFFYGNALWADGQKAKALEQWNAPNGVCSSPMACCKEPSEENTANIKLMASAGVDFDTFDEQGYSALDYAVLRDSPDAKEAIPVISQTVREALQAELASSIELDGTIDEELDKEIACRLHQSELRRHYRTILQENFRPLLRNKEKFSVSELRTIYSSFCSKSEAGQILAEFRYLRYLDLEAHGYLPISSTGLTTLGDTNSRNEDFVVFISYRWLGAEAPDDADGIQWRRIIDALAAFLEVRPDLHAEDLGIWLDYACIDQEDEQEQMRGVNALPLVLTLCNAMISLVDERYYERAWCAVETMLMGAVMQYGCHEWWEHVPERTDSRNTRGVLQRKATAINLDVSALKLSKEKVDRTKIDFLLRQSKLLGKDGTILS